MSKEGHLGIKAKGCQGQREVGSDLEREKKLFIFSGTGGKDGGIAVNIDTCLGSGDRSTFDGFY